MSKYEELLNQAAEAGIEVYSAHMDGHDGLYMDNVILLNDDLKTDAERACVLAEELAHHYTACGDITGSSALAIKQEIIGRRTAHEMLVPIKGLIRAVTTGCCRSKYEIAEYLEVTEEFLDEALQQYKNKYGLYVMCDGKMLCFEPLGVLSEM